MRGEADRRKTTVARAARPFALTVGGGVVLTLLSAGAATAGTGDATATGNQSGTSAGQSLTMKDGGIATVDAEVGNSGSAGSHTGTNRAVGNDGSNADDDTVDGKVNIDEVGNESDGEATVRTGWAWSGGNRSQTHVDQSGAITGGQSLVILQQGALVLNAGIGTADTGDNDGGPVAEATSGVAVLVLGQIAEIDNTGNTATSTTGSNIGDVTSGNATSQGNASRDRTGQGTVADGDVLAAAVVEQVSRNRNNGTATANTGDNEGDAGGGDDTDDLSQNPDPADLDTWLDLFGINV